MKKVLFIFVCIVISAVVVASCSSSPCSRSSVEPEVNDMPPIDPTGVWGDALVEYLAQFLPIFHNVRLVNTGQGYWWRADWYDFIEHLPIAAEIPPNLPYGGYGYAFVFRDPMTGKRLAIEDTPFLNLRSGVRDDGEIWSRTEIALGFRLLFLNNSDIPELIINWAVPPDAYRGGTATLHRFRDGAFEFVKELSTREGVGFYRADDGRVFIRYCGWILHRSGVNLHLIYFNDEIITEPALVTDWQTRTMHNFFTGETFDRTPHWDISEPADEILGYYLGMPLSSVVTPENLRNQIMEQVSARLRDEGIVG